MLQPLIDASLPVGCILLGYILGRLAAKPVIVRTDPKPEKPFDQGPKEEPPGDYFNDAVPEDEFEGRIATTK